MNLFLNIVFSVIIVNSISCARFFTKTPFIVNSISCARFFTKTLLNDNEYYV